MSADRSDATTGPVVPEQRGVRDEARAEVLHRHARLTKAGRPIDSTPRTGHLPLHLRIPQQRSPLSA